MAQPSRMRSIAQHASCLKNTPDPFSLLSRDHSGLVSRRDTGHLLRLEGQEWQQLLDVGHALQTVYPLYDSLRPRWAEDRLQQGSKWLRWILVELSIHAINGAPQFRSLYYRVSKKHGRNTARVAVARAMLKTIYAMLRKREPFRPIVRTSTGQRRGVMATA